MIEGMTPDKLNEIADWLDILDRSLDQLGIAWKTLGLHDDAIKLNLIRGPMPRNEMQNELRDWANQLEKLNA